MAYANTYDVADVVTVTGTFKINDVLTNPTAVTVKVKDPAGTVTSATPTNASTGIYTYDISVNASGEWWYRFEGTGAAAAGGEGVFLVRAQVVA